MHLNKLLLLYQYLCTLQAAVPDKELNAITSCFWIKMQKRSEEPTVLSYAVYQTDNEFLIFFNHARIKVLVKSGPNAFE